MAAPLLVPGAGRGASPEPAREQDQRALGLPGNLLSDWPGALTEAIALARRRHRTVELALSACTGCGACAEACHVFAASRDPLDLPRSRMELVERLGRSPSEALLLTAYTHLHRCSLCRRCAAFCPLGLDPSRVVLAGREALASVGVAAGHVCAQAADSFRSGNSLGLSPESWAIQSQAVEQHLAVRTGLDIACPVDEYGARVLLVPPAADLARHRRSFEAYAKLMHFLGVSWTTSTYVSDARNPGAYLDYRNMRLLARRVLEAARELRPRMVIWGESGHGWRVVRNWLGAMGDDWRGQEYLELKAPIHVLEYAHYYLGKGAFHGRLRREANDAKVVTIHDPCHLARSAGLLSEPRALIKASCHHFYEMAPATIGRLTLCCGGGGGMGPDMEDLRLAGFLPRARALQDAGLRHGCDWVAAPCDGCRDAIAAGLDHYGLAYGYGGVLELFTQALIPEDEPEALS